MYTMVLMLAAGSAGDTPDFFRRGGSCTGTVVAAPACPTYAAPTGCNGYATAPAGCSGRSGFLGLRSRLGGKRGGCHGASAGCNGYVAPISYGCNGYVAPVSYGCNGYVAPVSSYCAPVTTGCGSPCHSHCGNPCRSHHRHPCHSPCGSPCHSGCGSAVLGGYSTSYAAPMMGGVVGCEPALGTVVTPGTPVANPPVTMPEVKKPEAPKQPEPPKKNQL